MIRASFFTLNSNTFLPSEEHLPSIKGLKHQLLIEMLFNLTISMRLTAIRANSVLVKRFMIYIFAKNIKLQK